MPIGKVIDRAKNLPVVKQVWLVQTRYGNERAGYYADALTYQAFFAIFPTLLVASAVIGFVFEDPEARSRLVAEIASTIPGLSTIASDLLETLVEAREVVGLVGLLGLAWRGISVARSASTAVGAVHKRQVEESFWKALGRAGLTASSLGLFVIAGIALSVTSGWLPENQAISLLLLSVSVIVDIGLFLVAYRVLVPGGGPPFSKLLPGAIFAATGWAILKLAAASLAARYLTRASSLSGSFAVAVALLAMMSIIARLFMYGAIINVLHAEDSFRRMDREKIGPEEAAKPRVKDSRKPGEVMATRS